MLKSLEDAVFGGTINVGGTTLVVRVTSASADSSLAKLAQVRTSRWLCVVTNAFEEQWRAVILYSSTMLADAHLPGLWGLCVGCVLCILFL